MHKPISLITSLLVASSSMSFAGENPTVTTQASDRPLGSISEEISGSALWPQFVSRFVNSKGAVIDTGNRGISHSEGQGYGMVLAVAAGDKSVFDKMWSFTRQNLQVRKDNLLAWRYRHRSFTPVSDKNNATDGDILIGWALLEAADSGFGKELRPQGLAVLASVKKLLFQHPDFGQIILPGEKGFVEENRRYKVTINPSYWVTPALERLAILDGDPIWSELLESGRKIWNLAAGNRYKLPGDWVSLSMKNSQLTASNKFKYQFGYNSIRIPLYALWSGQPQGDLARSIVEHARPGTKTANGQKLGQVNLVTGRVTGRFSAMGYGAIEALVNCQSFGVPIPEHLKSILDKDYYPAVLQLLSITAANMRYPQCV